MAAMTTSCPISSSIARASSSGCSSHRRGRPSASLRSSSPAGRASTTLRRRSGGTGGDGSLPLARAGRAAVVARPAADPAGGALVLELLRVFWKVFHELDGELPRADNTPAVTAAWHRAILEALRAKDETALRAAAEEHFRGIRARVTPRG